MKTSEFVSWMHNTAKELHKDVDEWDAYFEPESAAYLLEWAAQIIVTYAPTELPPMKPRRS